MLYELLYSLHNYFSPLNVFRYITFRTSLASLTSLIMTLIIAPRIIRWLKRISITQQIRSNGPQTHLAKAGTPTMGGIIIVISIMTAVLLWGNFRNIYIWVLSIALLSFGAVGFIDDYLKAVKRNPQGLRAWYKFGAQVLIALVIGIFLYMNPHDPYNTVLSIPFFKKWL